MSRRWLLSLLCLSAAVVFVQFSAAHSPGSLRDQTASGVSGLRVNEQATRFLIQDQTIVLLEVSNPARQHLSAQLKLELLDPEDGTRGMAVHNIALQPGLNKLSIPLSLTADSLNEEADSALPWYRLRYRIDPAAEAKPAPAAATGVISLSEIDTPDIFALEVSASDQTHRGGRHYTHVRAFNPINAKPVKDVNVSVELHLDNDATEGTIKGSGNGDYSHHATDQVPPTAQ